MCHQLTPEGTKARILPGLKNWGLFMCLIQEDLSYLDER